MTYWLNHLSIRSSHFVKFKLQSFIFSSIWKRGATDLVSVVRSARNRQLPCVQLVASFHDELWTKCGCMVFQQSLIGERLVLAVCTVVLCPSIHGFRIEREGTAKSFVLVSRARPSLEGRGRTSAVTAVPSDDARPRPGSSLGH